MSWQGWIFMIFAWVLVGGLFFYSFYRVLFDSRIGMPDTHTTEREHDTHEKEH